MENTLQIISAPESAEQTAKQLLNNGVQCYGIARCWYVLWVPWKKQVLFVDETQKAKRLFGLTDGWFVRDVINNCLRDREIVQIPPSLSKRYPMPKPAPGERLPEDKEMRQWIRQILTAIRK